MIKIKETVNLNSAEELLLESLRNVSSEYLKHDYRNVKQGFQRPERLFNAELYHQLRLIQENGFTNFKIHTELNKRPLRLHSNITKRPHKPEKIPCIDNYFPPSIEPDIVFHAGPNNLKNQLLVAEIKMEGAYYLDILKDLNKLLYYKLSYLKYKNAVFIYTGYKSSFEAKLEKHLYNEMIQCLIKNNIVVALRSKTDKKTGWEIYEFDKKTLINKTQ
jgi:hypothetical protein